MKSKEERQESKAFRELRKENVKLRQEIRRLHKEIRQLEEMITFDDEEEVVPVVVEVVKPKKDAPRCPECLSKEIEMFTLKEKLYFICRNCGKKGKHEEKK